MYGCDQDTDALQMELKVKNHGDIELGGEMDVMPFGDKFDIDYRAPGASGELDMSGSVKMLLMCLIFHLDEGYSGHYSVF